MANTYTWDFPTLDVHNTAQNGDEISRTYHRHVLQCRTKSGDTWGDTDLTGEDATVRAVCNAVWTDDVKAEYEAFVDAQAV